MKKVEIFEISAITCLYIVLLIVMWVNLLFDANLADLKLTFLLTEKYGIYYFIMSTGSLFLLWHGTRFKFTKDIPESTMQRFFKTLALIMFEIQILLLTVDFGIEPKWLQLLIGLISTWIFGTFAISSLWDMLKSFSSVFFGKKH